MPVYGPASSMQRLLGVWQFVNTAHFRYFSALFMSFLCMGLCLAITGPSLLELGEQVNTDLDGLVWIFTGRSLGFFTGTIIGGDFVDRYRAFGSTILFLSLAIALLLNTLVPLVPKLGLLLTVCLAQGIALGIVDNVAQVLLIRSMEGPAPATATAPVPAVSDGTEKEGNSNGSGGESTPTDSSRNVQPYMQSLHAAFGVGGFVAPLIISPFVGGDTLYGGEDIDDGTGTGGDTEESAPAGSDTYHYAYFIVSFIMLPVCLSLGYYMLRDEIAPQTFRNRWNRLVARMAGQQGGAWTDLEAPAAAAAPGLAPPSTEESQRSAADIEMAQQASNDNVSGHEADSATLPLDRATATPPSHMAELLAQGQAPAPSMHVVIPLPSQPSSAASSAAHSPVHSPVPSSPSRVHRQLVQVISPDFDSSPSSSSSPLPLGPVHLSFWDSPAWVKWRMVLIISFFLFLYVGCESGYASYIYSYSTHQLHMDPKLAAYLNALFWLSFAGGRLLAIPLSLRFSATAMIFADLLGAILSVLMIMLMHDSVAVLWMATATYGLSVASIYPSAINYAESKFEVTGKVLSVLVVSASLGEAVLPLLMGLSFTWSVGPLGLMIIAAVIAVGATIIFAFIVFILAPMNQAREKEWHQAKERKKQKKSRRKKRASMTGATAAGLPASPSPSPSPADSLGMDIAAAGPPSSSRSSRSSSFSPSPKPPPGGYSAVSSEGELELTEQKQTAGQRGREAQRAEL